MSTPSETALVLEFVICTYNRAAELDQCLAALAVQSQQVNSWRVTVVDNNCSDATPDVVDKYLSRGSLPCLRRIVEIQQGLTPARLRGVLETSADWVAFIDDDCIVDPDWVANALAFASAHPEAGAFGGRVVPDWGGRPPRHAARNPWLYAGQDHGDECTEVESLVGAGIVINRQALAETGWTEGPLIADRIGRGSISGGDVELSLRLTAAGRSLFYTPTIQIAHRIPAQRQRLLSALSLARGLGAGAELISLMSDPNPQSWDQRSGVRLASATCNHIGGLRHVLLRRTTLRDWMIIAAFQFGQHESRRSLITDSQTHRRIAGKASRQSLDGLNTHAI